MIILSFDIGIKNLAYCQIDSTDKTILDWTVLNCDSNNIVLTIINELDKITNLLESDIILLEKQPSFNPKMRIISTALYVYFTLRISSELEKKIKIIYYSAKHKLKLCNDTEILTQKTNNKSKNYRLNKKAAIEQTIILLNQNNSSFLPFFNKHKKKDDLADSYLQALSYLNN